jgi:hypothetical protein
MRDRKTVTASRPGQKMQSRTPVLASRAMLVSQFIRFQDVLRDCEDKIFGPPWEALRNPEFVELARSPGRDQPTRGEVFPIFQRAGSAPALRS